MKDTLFMDGRTDGRTDGRMEGQQHGRTDGQTGKLIITWGKKIEKSVIQRKNGTSGGHVIRSSDKMRKQKVSIGARQELFLEAELKGFKSTAFLN